MTDIDVKQRPLDEIFSAKLGSDPTLPKNDGFEKNAGPISMVVTKAGYVAYVQYQTTAGIWKLYSRCVARRTEYSCTQERADGKKMSDTAVAQRLKNFSGEVMRIEYERTTSLHAQKLKRERATNKDLNETLLNQGAELSSVRRELEELRAAAAELVTPALNRGSCFGPATKVVELIAKHLRSHADREKPRATERPREEYNLAP